jgi:hypothetical protein
MVYQFIIFFFCICSRVILSRRRVVIIASKLEKFEKLQRAWFCSDRRPISAENSTAHCAVYRQERNFKFFKEIDTS